MAEGYVRARRTRIRGLPQSPAVIRVVPRPFVRGINTELPSWALDPQETPSATDMIFPKGVAVPRGPYVSATPAGLSGMTGDHLLSAIAVDLPSYGGTSGQPFSPLIVGVDSDQRIGVLHTSWGWANATLSGFSTWLPREVYKGEILWCNLSGDVPIVRFAGAPANSIAAPAASAGTVATVAGSNSLTGSGTTFTTQAPVGSYVGIAGYPGVALLVKNVASTTQLTTDAPLPNTASGLSWGTASRVGQLGLCTPLPSDGVVSMTGGSPTVTGFGTNWVDVVGRGAPAAGDYIGIEGNFDRLQQISSIASDLSLTMTTNAPSSHTQQPYVIYRPAVGKEIRYHNGRLYITGVDWDDTGIYYTPVNMPLGSHQNTDQPNGTLATNFAVSQCLLKFDVPIEGAQGSNMALLSTPQGLLILRSNAAYIMYGDPPAQSVQLLADGAGCVGVSANCLGTKGEGAFWAGQTGIFRYTGGRVVDLTEGRRNREWRALMRAVTLGAPAVDMAVLDGHLFVNVSDLLGTQHGLWVYDFSANAWCGNFSGSAITGMTQYQPAQGTANDPDVYFTSVTGMGAITPEQAGRFGGIVRDEGGLGTSSLNGTFSADLPESIVGPPDDLSRVTEAKVVYELTGGDGTTKLRLSSNVDGGSYGTDADLAVVANGPQEERVMPISDVSAPSSGALGKLGRRHGHRLSQQGTKPTALRVHQIDLVVRPRRPRA